MKGKGGKRRGGDLGRERRERGERYVAFHHLLFSNLTTDFWSSPVSK